MVKKMYAYITNFDVNTILKQEVNYYVENRYDKIYTRCGIGHSRTHIY